MQGAQKTARIAGLFFIGTFVFSIPAVILYNPALKHHHDFILGSGFDKRIATGALLEVLLAICNIATAVVIYPIVKRVNNAVALGYVASRTVESTIIVIGLISLMSVLTLRHDLGGTAADPGSLRLVGRSLVAFHEWTFLLGPQFCAGFGNGLLLGYLMYKSQLVPPRMALVGMIGGPLAFLGGVLALFDVFADPSTGLSLLTIPEIVWEAFIAIYWTFVGFRRSSPLLAGDVAAAA
jgi:Domain of unknown function (DUF4386)